MGDVTPMSRLTHNQVLLLRAVADGHVLWRRHLRCGWAIRRADVRSGGPGGALGRRVDAAITNAKG
jgi:hypothetical protein